MLYGQNMTNADLITATEATRLLGYQNRSSLTRLVQAEKIKPAFTASGKRGEQFFNRSDIMALLPATIPAESQDPAGVSFVHSPAS